MGRVAKKAPASVAKESEESPTQTITQTRTRRTPKPNPKYTNESIVVPPKIESDTPGSSDAEGKADEEKVVKPLKKFSETPSSVKGKTPGPKGKAASLKKQKLDYDDEEDDKDKHTDDEKPTPATTRATRSGKGDAKDTMKIGDDSVAIVDVLSIISKAPRGPGRKRAVPEGSPKEDQAKKKKEDEKPSLITARKSYMPSPAVAKKADLKAKEEAEDNEETTEDKKEVPKSLASTIKTRRNAGAAPESPQTESAEKKLKVEEIKLEESKPEMKKLVMKKTEQAAKVTASGEANKSSGTLPTRILNNTIVTSPQKPVPRILNSMVTPKVKQSPNVKLAGDGSDKKVFSIDLTDDSVKEKKIASPTFKPSVRPPVAVKENVANNKPQPAMVLKNKLESELIRMKASANMVKRQQILPQPMSGRHSLPSQQFVNANAGTRRITKFESWYVIDVKNQEPITFRHTHTHSLIKLGNDIKSLQLPSADWDYKLTLQRRPQRSENNNDEEVYTGDVGDKSIEADKANFEPNSILFKRSHRESNKVSIDRSLMLKQSMYTITINGKQCKLIGAPDDIKSIEDLEILLNIIDSCTLQHSCVEPVTTNDVITIS